MSFEPSVKSAAGLPSALADGACVSQQKIADLLSPAPSAMESHLGNEVIETLYAMILDEIAQPQYDQRDIALFRDPIYYYGRYLEPRTRKYALHNLVSNISVAIAYLRLGGWAPNSIVDLGCGLGMQSIIFASLGAHVLGIDLRGNCITLCEKRRRYFEKRLGRPLKMDFLQADFRTLDPSSIGRQFDGLFSMSAFAYIDPLTDTVAKISHLLNGSGRVFLWDHNPDFLFLNALTRRRSTLPAPAEIVTEFAKQGFTTDLLRGASAIPHHFWHPGVLFRPAAALNGVMKKSLRLSFSYLFGASRRTNLLVRARAVTQEASTVP